MINNIDIKRVNSMNILGIIFEENLDWKNHILHVENKISKSIGIMHKIKHLLNKTCLKNIYYSFIHSYITYCNIVWASTCSSALKKIYTKQKQACRIVLNVNRCAHAKPLFREIGASNIYELNLLQNLVFIFQSQNDLLPKYFENQFSIIDNKYPTKYSINNFKIPNNSLKKADFSILSRGPRLWNSILKEELKKTSSQNSFKKAVKQYLFDSTDSYILSYF